MSDCNPDPARRNRTDELQDKINRIEGLINEADDNEQFIVNTRAVRAILRGE